MHSGFRNSRDKKRLMAEINVVPYIDVTLVLLIIFMVTAPIVQQAVTVELPQTPETTDNSEPAANQEPPFVITVTQNGLYKTSEDPNVVLGKKDLQDLVANVVARTQINENITTYIQGDEKAPYGTVVHLFVLLKSNGVDRVSLMTEPERDES